MLNASKDTLKSFFTNNLQYVVPFFQRSYVWDEENWEVMWEHVERTALAIKDGNIEREHFIGTLITKQREAQTVGDNKRDLVDGQQRLTTFAVLLKCIAVLASGAEPYTKLPTRINELIQYEDSKGERHNRIEHSKNDKDYFDAIIKGTDLGLLPNQGHRILRCFKYFSLKLKGMSDEELDNLKEIILNNVPVVSMLLAPNDDEQEIFDTINSLGVKLTTGELLKNFIFSEVDLREYYSKLWEPVFEEDEAQVDFWNKNKTSGRFTRTNVEVLLYCYLIIQRKSSVELDRLFKEYKNWLKDTSLHEKIGILEEIKGYAELYSSFPDSTALNEIRFSDDEARFFHVIERLEITTVYPLVLFIYRKVTDPAKRVAMLRILESYIVRRQVCRLTSKNYNNVFIKMIKDLDEIGEVSAEALEAILEESKEDTNRKPNDAEFSMGIFDEPISNANAREVLFCIALYQQYDPKNDVQKLSADSFSTEHMMPQKWEEHWNDTSMDDLERLARNRKIKTLGNLTLVTQSLNSSMRNSKWDIKRNALKNHSLLKITTDYVDKETWDESDILARATDLALIAQKIWQ